MQGIIKLIKPLKVDGTDLTELKYNTDDISVEQFCQADMARQAASQGPAAQKVIEFDSGLHLYLGFYAIIAASPNLDIHDLERLSGRDLLEAMRVGRNFILNTESAPSNADNSVATIAEPTEPE